MEERLTRQYSSNGNFEEFLTIGGISLENLQPEFRPESSQERDAVRRLQRSHGVPTKPAEKRESSSSGYSSESSGDSSSSEEHSPSLTQASPPESSASETNNKKSKKSKNSIESDIEINQQIAKSCGASFTHSNTQVVVVEITKLLFRYLKDVPKRQLYYLPTGMFLLCMFGPTSRPSCPRIGYSNMFSDIISEAYHGMKYAAAIYGWQYNLAFRSIFLHQTDLTIAPIIGNFIHQDGVNIPEISSFLNIPSSDIVQSQWGTKAVFDPAHMISVDRSRSRIIVSIRGTMTVKDSLTDLVCKATPFYGGWCHQGMLEAAEHKLKSLTPHLVDTWRRLAEETGVEFEVNVIGHSLGAGTAAILSVILRETLPDTIKMKCLAFACPAVMSEDLCEKYKSLIWSFICEDDVVPRLTYVACVKLASRAIEARKEVGQKLKDKAIEKSKKMFEWMEFDF